LEKIFALADNREFAGLDKLEINADAIDLNSAKLANLLIEGVRLAGARTTEGGVRFAGVELREPTLSSKPQSAAPAVTSSGQPVPPIAPAGTPYRISVGEVAVRDVRATFDDSHVSPPSQLAFVVEQISSKAFSSMEPSSLSRPSEWPSCDSVPKGSLPRRCVNTSLGSVSNRSCTMPSPVEQRGFRSHRNQTAVSARGHRSRT
jgi:hypothetical protein